MSFRTTHQKTKRPFRASSPLPGEEALYGTFKSLLDAAAKDPKIKDTLIQTAIAAEEQLIKPLFDFHNNGRPVGNGWTSPPNGARWGTDYLSRTASAKSNMYDNAPNETRYIYTDFDKDGQRLSGANRYTVTLAAGQTPPVNGFWSLTVYNKEHFFEPNEFNRFSLGTKSIKSMKENVDGALTLYFQNKSPGQAKEANWVPTPRRVLTVHPRLLAQGRNSQGRVDPASSNQSDLTARTTFSVNRCRSRTASTARSQALASFRTKIAK